MLTSNSDLDPDVWSLLQEPARPATHSASYMLLLSALDSGWEISEPVHLISGKPPDYQWVYHFFLQLPSADLTCQIIVEESPEVNYFVYEEKLRIKI